MALMIAGMKASKWVARQNKRIQRIASYKAMGGTESTYYQNIASTITAKGIGRVNEQGIIQIDTKALTREYGKVQEHLKKAYIGSLSQIETQKQIRERVSKEIIEDMVRSGELEPEEKDAYKVSYSRLKTRFKQNEEISKFMSEYGDRTYFDRDVLDFFNNYSDMSVKDALTQIRRIRKRSSEQIEQARIENPFNEIRVRDERRKR